MKNKILSSLSMIILLSASLAFSAVTIKTNTIKYVGLDSAISGGNIISTGGEQITEAGICWSKTPQPTINDSKAVRTSSIDSFTCVLTGLLPGQAYYARAYTVTASGVTYGPQRTFATDILTLGAIIKGGRVFYVLKPGDPGYIEGELHGLVVCPEMINPPIGRYAWANKIDTFLNVTDTALFTGESNTIKIVTALGPGQYAAWMCYDLIYNGYTDWFLPSKNELQLIRKTLVPSTQLPWSSSETDSTKAYQILNSVSTKASPKSQLNKVIAIRKF